MKKYLRPSVDSYGYFRPFFIGALLVLAFSTLPNLALAETFPMCTTLKKDANAFEICLTNVTYDLNAGTSTWTYSVTTLQDSENNLSHITFGIPCGTTASDYPATSGDCENVSFGEDPTTGVSGIKFDCEANKSYNVSFTINGLYSIGTIDYGAKTGGNNNQGPPGDEQFILGQGAGPDCNNTISADVSLNLVAECKVDNLVYWRVVGDDDVDNVAFTWDGPVANDGNGVVNADDVYYFTTVDDGGSNTTTITWFNPATNQNEQKTKAHNNWPCVYHIVFEKQWSGVLAPDLKDVVILTAKSSFATAECGYDANGNWYCTYTRKTNNPLYVANIPETHTASDLEVPFGETYSVYEVPVSGWISAAGTGTGFERVAGFDASALPNALVYELANDVYSTDIQGKLAKFGLHTVVNEEGSLTGDCESGQFWLKNYGLIALGDLNAVNHIELNGFIGGNLNITGALDIGSLLTNSNFGIDKSRNAIEVVGTVANGSIIKLLNYSGAFGPSNTIVAPMSGIQWMVNGRMVEVQNGGAALTVDYSLAAKAAQIKADLKAASDKLSQATANNTVGGTVNNRVFDAANVDGNGVAVFNLPDASVFSASSIAFANSGGASTIIINVPGTTINSTANIGGSSDEDIIIWNFYEATSLSFNGSVTGSILAPMADITVGTNVDGVIVGQDISIGSQSHDPFFAGDFSFLCSNCQIDAQFSQACDGSDAVIITVLATGAPSGQYLVKDGATTVAGPANNGTTVQFAGSEGTQYTVVDNVDANCSTTFTTSTQITGCDDEETCPTATFFDMAELGFTGADLIGDNGNFNAIIGGNFTTNGTGDTEGRLAVGGNFSNTGAGLYTIGEISGSGASRASIGTDNLVVVGDIDGSVGLRGNVVYGGTGSGISFIAGTDNTGIQRQVNDVANNVLDIPAAISYFQGKSMALATCTGGTEGTVNIDEFSSYAEITLDGLNATGVVYFDIPSTPNVTTAYNFINVSNASAILVNVGGTAATFSNGSVYLEGLANQVPQYPIDNMPAGELEFTEKTLWNFYEATTFSLSNYAIMGSVLAPNADATLSGGGINGQVVFGGNVTVSGGFEFHNFCYNADIDMACSLFYDFGDLPNNYPQARAEVEDNNNDGTPDGANSVWAGTIVDTEGAQNFSANADGDDQNGSDDEDGLTLPTFTPGQTSTVTISLNSAANNTEVYYGLWFDYNCDGDFTDSGDQFFSGSKTVATGGNPETENISVTPPLSATGDYKVRLIVSDDPISSNDVGNTFDNGEVEDYKGTMLCDMSLTDLTVSTCSNNSYTLTFDVEWVGAPTTGDFEVIVYENDVPGSPQTVTRTNFNAAGTQMIDINAACDAEINKIEVRFKDQATCSALAVFPAEPIDPQGYIYCVGTGEIITGGTISVTPPPGGSAVIYSDGSNGFYDFFTDGTPGVYTITYNPPMGYSLTGTPGDRVGDTDDVLDPMAGSEDNPMGQSPLVLGSGDADNNGFLDDFSLQNNPFFLEVRIVNGTPAVMNNNIPLNCPTVITSECISVEEPNFESVRTAKRDKDDGNTLSITKPNNVANGDLLLAVIATDGGKTVTAPTNSNPWMLFNEGSSNGGNNDGTSLAIFYKIADASDVSASNYTFTASANAQMAGAILRYSNVDTSDPINSVFGVANAPAESNMPTAPDVTSPINLPKVLRVFASDDDELPVTHPSGHNDIVELESRTGQGNSFPDRVTLGIAEKNTQQGIGSTGDGKFTISDSEQWRAITILINPAPGSGNAPSFATPTSAVGSCRQGVPQEDATITLENIMNADRIDISSPGATSYDGDDYADAESLDSNPEFTFSGLMHSTQYIIRLFNGDDNCYTDVTITTSFIECSPALCEEGIIIDFDTAPGNVVLNAGTEIGGDGTQPYENLFGTNMGMTFESGNPNDKPLTLYNSEPPVGNDIDLERVVPNGNGTWAFGNIPNENLRNLLIINQTSDPGIPDDNQQGGMILSTSTMYLSEFSFDIVDYGDNSNQPLPDKIIFQNMETGESAQIDLDDFAANANTMWSLPGVVYGERSANRITGITAQKLGISAFNKITFQTDDSFGIGTICVKKARTDFGDLPDNYPVATAILGPDANNDGKPEGKADGTTGGAVWAGSIVDAEATQNFSLDATGDDTVGSDDEDGLSNLPAEIFVDQPAQLSIVLNSNQNGTNMYYGLWFDWNGDGDFTDMDDAFFTNAAAIVYNGSPVDALISFTPPVGAVSDYAVRLIVSDMPITSSDFDATITNGEVEDYSKPVKVPVELLDFSATPVDNERVLLKWSTATETNNAYFSVQRSRDGIKWTTEIGRVKGAGNSLETLHYSYWDEAPLIGINYYRLQQFDLDGQFEYHKVVTARIEGKVSERELVVYPTVSKTQVNIALGEQIAADEELYVVDLTGRVVLRRTLQAGTELYTLDISELTSGHFIVMVRSATATRIGKFVKG